MPDIGFRPVTNLENFSILARMGIIVTDTANAPGRSQILRICGVSWPLGVNIGSAGLNNELRGATHEIPNGVELGGEVLRSKAYPSG
jgi:hypothetical protein